MLLPYQNIIIKPAIGINASNNYWVIIDDDGKTYYFGVTDNSKELIESQISNQTEDKAKTYVSTWYLSEITAPNTNEKISFTYEAGGDIEYRNYRKNRRDRLACFDAWGTYCEDNPVTEIEEIDNIIKVYSQKYLSRISSSNTILSFNHLRL